MTVLMTFVGTIVFIISCFTVGFRAGWKRLMLFALTGLIIDCLIIAVSLFVTFALTL